MLNATTDPNAGNNAAAVDTKVVNAACGPADRVLTSADNGAASGYMAKNSITARAGFAVGAGETVSFTVGESGSVMLENDVTIGGHWAASSQAVPCP